MTTAQLQEAARQTTLAYFGYSVSEDPTGTVLIPAFLKDLAKEPHTYETMNALVLGILAGTTDFVQLRSDTGEAYKEVKNG